MVLDQVTLPANSKTLAIMTEW